MGKDSKVTWADSSHGFWYGCTKVSTGCKFCYAERQMSVAPSLPPFTTVSRSKGAFSTPLSYDPGRVFVNPWSDFFHPAADQWRDEAWNVIRRGTMHQWIILTKRPELVVERLPSDWGNGWPHVWLGVSVEDMAAVARRLPILVEIPAKMRIVSAEPLLGPLTLRKYLSALSWVVVGGESGPQHRPMDIQWARLIRDDCVRVNIPFFFKQIPGLKAGMEPYIVEQDGSHTIWNQIPDPLPIPAILIPPTQLTLF